ncbi:MAG: flagellar biosynthetic protein FliR [Polyangia bacterium]
MAPESHLLAGWLGAALLVLARVGPVLLLVPFLSLLPRLLLALGATAVLLPLGVVRADAALAEPLRLLPLLGRELLVGAALAAAAAMPWLVARGAGAWLDSAQTGRRHGPLATLYLLLALALLFGLGGARTATQALALSYELFPVALPAPEVPALAPAAAVTRLGPLFALALWLGLPVFLTQQAAELLLSLGLRIAAPGFGVPAERPLIAPLRAAAGPLALLVGAGAAVTLITRLLAAQPQLVRQMLDTLAGR